MTKKRGKSDSDGRQLSLFDLLKQADELRCAPAAEGSLGVANRLRLALSQAIKDCPLKLHQIAGEMSHLLGESITAEMIYSWTAESKTQHQIWASRLPAFCRVTRTRQPMEIMAEAAGLHTMPGPEALRAEIQRFSEAERAARAEKKKREMFLLEITEKRPNRRKNDG